MQPMSTKKYVHKFVQFVKIKMIMSKKIKKIRLRQKNKERMRPQTTRRRSKKDKYAD